MLLFESSKEILQEQSPNNSWATPVDTAEPVLVIASRCVTKSDSEIVSADDVKQCCCVIMWMVTGMIMII